MERHIEAVAAVSASVRHFYERKEAFRIYHGSTNSTRTLAFEQKKMVDTSDLSHVVKIDWEANTVLVEPNVPMDRLVEATLPKLVPPVVMEFPGITVGGGFAGTAGESSSFRHGFFDRTVNWIEIVLANGDVVRASKTERPELFHGAAGTFGTLGVLTLLELQLIPAKEYVQLTYFPVNSLPGAIQRLEKLSRDTSIDYVDGILFAANRGVVITGRLTNLLSLPKDTLIQRFSRGRDPWFYLHAEELCTKFATPIIEAVPLVDYLFRYDRGAFWTGRYAFRYFITPFNRFTRWALDYFMHTRVMYHALHESGQARRYIIQDLALPFPSAQEFIEYIDKALGLYPLWLCPLRQHEHHQVSLHPHSASATITGGMLLNVGVWGPGSTSQQKFVQTNRDIEKKVRELSGMKWLYAHAYYTEEEFWSIYNRKWYEELRIKYHATSLPSVFDKVRVHSDAPVKASGWIYRIWPLSGLRGVAMAILGSNYIIASERPRHHAAGVLFFALGLLVAVFGLVWLRLQH
ncbi:hypothetical protein MMC30_000911 [Trapelia coarctata]|nr:hypothetical protein [Trapelia coarctata]